MQRISLCDLDVLFKQYLLREDNSSVAKAIAWGITQKLNTPLLAQVRRIRKAIADMFQSIQDYFEAAVQRTLRKLYPKNLV